MAANQEYKRMRLGTRSCFECRRRKVRCVFDGEAKTCRQCKLHETVCKAQGSKGTSDQSHHVSDETDKTVSAVSTDTSTVPEVACGHDGPASAPAPNADHIVSRSSHAPLVRFLHEVLPVAPTPDSREANAAGHLASSRSKISIPPCPNASALVRIFQCTEPFWALWPLAAAASENNLCGFPGNVIDAITRRQVPFVVGTLLLQLPKVFVESSSTQLPLPKRELVDFYLRRATVLINESLESRSDALRGIEALAIQYKCCLDLGQPQQAWKCARRAIDHALILGIDRVQGQSSSKDRYRQFLWTTIWAGDRRMALFLGLPYAVPGHDVAQEEKIPSLSDESKMFIKLNLICGHIIDRNRSVSRPPYSVTSRISEEMDALRAETSDASWWDLQTAANADLPMAIVFMRRATSFFFHYTNQLLHLPYMLQGRCDDKYRYSRTAVLSSAEVMLHAWCGFPCSGTVPVACDYLDFCAFNAAVILAAEPVSSESTWLVDEETRQWDLIIRTAEVMQCKADILDSTLPAQSAQVLRTLHSARHRTLGACEMFEVVIPYLGKIRIKQPSHPTTQTTADYSVGDDTDGGINFDMTSFDLQLPAELDPILELGVDWSQLPQLWNDDSSHNQTDV